MTDFFEWNVKKGQQGKQLLSSSLLRKDNCSFLNENYLSGIQNEKKPIMFKFSVFMQFLSNYRWTSWTRMFKPPKQWKESSFQ